MIEQMKYKELNRIVSYSPGNRKIGEFTPSVSLAPTGICRAMPCFKKCYAVSMYRYQRDTKNAWDRNLKIALEAPETYFRVISRLLEISLPVYFRWHVAGELPSSSYLAEVIRLAERHHRTKFLMFTKRYDLLSSLGRTPDNLVIIMSVWPGLAFPALRFRKAFAVTDSTSSNGVKCPGYCPDCGFACWEEDDRDVVFDLR